MICNIQRHAIKGCMIVMVNKDLKKSINIEHIFHPFLLFISQYSAENAMRKYCYLQRMQITWFQIQPYWLHFFRAAGRKLNSYEYYVVKRQSHASYI